MIERIEDEIHRRTLAVSALTVMLQSMRDAIVHANQCRRRGAYFSVERLDFFPIGCELNAIETTPLSIECMSVWSNGIQRCERAAATADRKWSIAVEQDNGAERSETAEGKMEESVLLVPEKRVCTRFETAPRSKASAAIDARSIWGLGFTRAVCAGARWSMLEGGR